jgi:hypothetical protein
MKKKTTLIIIIGFVVLIIVGIVSMFWLTRMISSSGITTVPDNMFGDQHLKTTVALLELHRVRYGEYPEKLSDLKFIGSWDRNALYSVQYIVSEDHNAYYVEVTRGWIGKPDLKMPDEFWQGTGYDPSLKQ